MKIRYKLEDIEHIIKNVLRYSILSFPFYKDIEKDLIDKKIQSRFFRIFYGRLAEQLFIETFNVKTFDNRDIFYKDYDDGDAILEDVVIDIKTNNIDRNKFNQLNVDSIDCNLPISTYENILYLSKLQNRMYFFIHADFSIFQVFFNQEEKDILKFLTKYKDEIKRSRLEINQTNVDLYVDRVFENDRFSNSLMYDSDIELIVNYTGYIIPTAEVLEKFTKNIFSYSIKSKNIQQITNEKFVLLNNKYAEVLDD